MTTSERFLLNVFELFFWILFWFKICKLISRSVDDENGEIDDDSPFE